MRRSPAASSSARSTGARTGWRTSSSVCSIRAARKRRAARAEIERANQLNRNDPVVLGALKDVQDGKRLDPLEVNQRALTTVVAGAPPP